MPGPAPKRSSQRRRRNKTEVEKATSDGEARAPKLTGRHSALGRRFWDRLSKSGQAQFFEPSDWAQAELAVVAIDVFVREPSAAMLRSIDSMMTGLLVTEGARRRVRLELEAPVEAPGLDDEVAKLDEYRRRLSPG